MWNPRSRVTKAHAGYPEPRDSEKVVVVKELLGHNTCDVVDQDGSSMVVDIPGKLKKRVYISKGDYLIVEPYEGKKNQGIIQEILQKDQIQHLKSINKWPSSFNTPQPPTPTPSIPTHPPSDDGSSSDEPTEYTNPNHASVPEAVSDEEYSF